MAAWGDIAVGQRRPAGAEPTRSAVLGLVAASLGLRRDDADGLMALDASLGFASMTDSGGELLVDYHTAQGPAGPLLRQAARARGRAAASPRTRREELGFERHDLETILSQRQYRLDGHWRAALWLRDIAAPRWSLDQLAQALRQPRFIPYLGRRSCPLDAPLEPQVISGENPVEAMARMVLVCRDVLDVAVRHRHGEGTAQWEGTWEGLVPMRTVRRRDAVVSRSRWQFTVREEHQMSLATKGGGDVPESN
jgi:CRISPR system Cascade subunit CasD